MISVIVPVYRVEAWLPRCLDSLLGQTLGDFEIIAVDDGSPDGCGRICDVYAARDPRIRVIHKKNGGLSDARNAGLDVAAGAYIAFVDSDDWVSPRYLELLSRGLEEGGGDICECGVFPTEGESCPDGDAPTIPLRYPTEAALGELIGDGCFYPHVWNKLYRREVIGDIRFPLGKTNEDEFWTYQVFGRAKTVTRVEQRLYNYFRRPGSIMNEGYSLKRLDGLEAKWARQEYVRERFPALEGKAGGDLWLTCVYAGQMSLKYLKEPDRTRALETIEGYLAALPLNTPLLHALPRGTAVWALAGKLSFRNTCRLRNLLKKGL